MPPRSSVTAFHLGYRAANSRAFLDQVDSKLFFRSLFLFRITFNEFWNLMGLGIVGVNMGGLVQVDQQALVTEQTQQHRLLARLRLDHDAAELDLEGFLDEEQELGRRRDKLQENFAHQLELVEDAYARRDVGAAVGLALSLKNLRIELAVRLRDLEQKAMALLDVIRSTHQKLSAVEFDMIRVEHRVHMIQLRLRPVNNLNDALNA